MFELTNGQAGDSTAGQMATDLLLGEGVVHASVPSTTFIAIMSAFDVRPSYVSVLFSLFTVDTTHTAHETKRRDNWTDQQVTQQRPQLRHYTLGASTAPLTSR